VAEDLHAFIKGQLWLKLKTDVQNLFVASRAELVSAAYFHLRRLLLIQPGWTCRVRQEADGPDLLVRNQGSFRAAIRCEFAVSAAGNSFPSDMLSHRMSALLEAVNRLGGPRTGRGYLVGVFDSPEPALYPEEDDPESQVCFWLPVNCRDLPNYAEWRARWEKLSVES